MRFILIVLLIFAPGADAASHYIRVAASGANDGSSWTNAFTAIPGTLTRGDTYYLAGGTYVGDVTLASTVSGSTLVTLKKANVSDNGSDPGWNLSYATTQALIEGNFEIVNSYTIIEGVTGSSRSGYGIKILQPTGTSGNAIFYQDDGTSFVQVLHLELEGPGQGYSVGVSGVKNNNTGSPVKGNHYANLYFHGLSENGFVFVRVAGTSYADYGLLFENNILDDSGYNVAGQHGQGIQCGSGFSPGMQDQQSYWIVRNSIFHNFNGTGMIACLGYSSNDHFEIYNNVFWDDNYSFNTTWIPFDNSAPASSPGVIYFSSTSQSADNILVANNTFYQMSRATVFIDGTATNSTVTNNLWTDDNFNIITQGATGSYNDYYGCFTIISMGIFGCPYGETGQQGESMQPTVNPSTGNFHLVPGANAIGNGQNLSSIFTVDAAGNARAPSGPWDIGALNFIAGTQTPKGVGASHGVGASGAVN